MIPEKSLTLKVFTPDGPLHVVKGLTAITIPLANGYPIGIRPGHAPLIAETAQGSLRYRHDNLESELGLFAGILKIRNNEVIIFTAGELTDITAEKTPPQMAEYDRLMKTLVN